MPLSLHARIASVKINVLPRINFLSSIIPLPAPKIFWHKLNSTIHKFIWNGKQPRLKFESLQRAKHNGGLALSNFELYHRTFKIKRIKVWINPLSRVSWERDRREPSRQIQVTRYTVLWAK